MNIVYLLTDRLAFLRISGYLILGILLLLVISGSGMRSANAERKGEWPGRPESSEIKMASYSIVVQGRQRNYWLYVPNGLSGHKVPLLLALHGGGGDAERMARLTNFNTLADKYRFIVAYPKAIDHWNDGRETTASEVDDVFFLTTLIEDLVSKYPIDHHRVYVTGVSNGGMMTLRLACDASKQFAAFGAVIANLASDLKGRCNPSRPVPLILIHGTEDRFMPAQGGEIPRSQRRGKGGRALSIEETVNFWVHKNGCRVTPDIKLLPDTDPSDNVRVERREFQGCNLVQLTMIGGGHTWPGHAIPSYVGRFLGRVGMDINASEELWHFFQQYQYP